MKVWTMLLILVVINIQLNFCLSQFQFSAPELIIKSFFKEAPNTDLLKSVMNDANKNKKFIKNFRNYYNYLLKYKKHNIIG